MAFIFSVLCIYVSAQGRKPRRPAQVRPDSAAATVVMPPSASVGDTTRPVSPKVISANAISSVVEYSAKDSVVNDLQNRRTYLFGGAVVRYENMELSADYIEIDFSHNELYACGVADSNGVLHGNPVFTQESDNYRAREIMYNFTTKKVKISHVITTQDDGFIHGEQVKKMGDNVAFIKRGKYTTCELEDPHFEIAFSKAKVIQHDKILIGPAYLSFTGVPTPLALPFGFFPLDSKHKSGLVMPSIGQAGSLGFYLRDLGFYFAINDNIDLLLSADLYTRGSWALKAKSNYVYRYKCNGVVEVAFARSLTGDRIDTANFKKSNNYKIYWDHKQDSKSHPRTRFNAHIDMQSANYARYNMTSANDYLSNQFTSSVSFSTSAADIFFLDAGISFSQNTGAHTVNMKLPNISMSVAQFYPFRKKDKAGKLKWYDNISMKWTSQLVGQINTTDSMFLKPLTWQQFETGMMHTIPITIPIKIAKTINWNTSVTLTEKWYLQHYTRGMTWDSTAAETPVLHQYFNRKFGAVHDLNISSNLTTKVYVMYTFKKGGLNAIRHIITPTLNFTFQPKLNGRNNAQYVNPMTGEIVEYTYYDNAIFGGGTSRMTARAQVSFGNNVEIKVRSKRDTVTGIKKVPIIDNFNISMYYDFAADSMNWSTLTMSGRSTLFKQLYLTYSFIFDPYSINEKGRRVNITEWAANRRLLRFSGGTYSVSLNYRIDQNTFKSKDPERQKNRLPWSLTFNYTFTYGINDNLEYYRHLYQNTDLKPYAHNMVHTLNVAGDINITKKWRVGFTTGYDFVQKSLSYTSLDFHRDMHCWEMSFNWIPVGYRKGWSFTINVKSSTLRDVLKYKKEMDFRDNL
ncbi:MAG: LPS-assembly protein LptD [Bacteroidales bacterium]|nr:LPS-assembly protein LptD [Bacteroidales bacterium]